MSFFVYQAALASENDAVDIIRTIQIGGLSLNSTPDDIEAFIETKPSLECKRIDVPERKSKIPSRRSSPRQQSWNCSYSHKTLSEVLNIRMSDGVISYLNYETGYDKTQLFEKTRLYIRGIHKKLEAAGLTSHQKHLKNFMTYEEKDIQGGSAPVFMQHLNAKKTVSCDNIPIYFLMSMNANTLPSQNIYRAGMKIERSRKPIHCKNIE
ncbi:hypothetical protein [Paremcibacter congregatus]|nr:hypothetical protein [Paremcibacter congregatus]QDE25970.1 hypothetical protein FIV45_01070 [Paremcibacter congregatus]